MHGFGAHLPEDVVYSSTSADQHGNLLNGKNKYIIHFHKGDFPPVRGFWSLSLYNDKDFFLVENHFKRYHLCSKNHLKHNHDGSLDLYIQHDSPDTGKEDNWLPSPQNNFKLVFRFYWPDESLLNNSWKPPVIALVE